MNLIRFIQSFFKKEPEIKKLEKKATASVAASEALKKMSTSR